MTNDMTKGNPVRLILAFMIPTYLGNIFQQFYNLVDSIVAGRYIGVNALAAIGSTTSLIFLVIGWLNGITSGFAIMVAQSFGAKDYKKMRHFVAMSVILCLAFVVVMTAGLLVLNYPILKMMNVPDDIIGDTAAYMAIIYAGLLVTAAYNAFAAVLRALGDSKSPLYFLIISALVNVVLDVVFIVVFRMGVEGCAYATVIAQGISALLCLVYIVRKFEILKLGREDFRRDFAAMGQLLAMGVPMGLQFSITAIGTIIVQGAVNVFGAVYIAGFSAAGKIQSLVTSVFIAFGATIATYVGQNRGAGQMERIRQGVRSTQVMILIGSAFMFLIIHFFGEPLTYIFVDSSQTEVIAAAKLYFTTVAWCYPFLGSIFLYRNALQGLGYGFMPMMGGVFELIARSVVVAFVARAGWGFVGTCASDPAAWVAALIPIVPYYFYKIKKIMPQVS
ncbi:MATE family efflux transporter [Clostridium sp. AN503]|uniref:MATE family efflux transporter n=1 Tax=Clostridium sp. AN503 TaxID=3160598 RepID=UPI00345AC6B9